MIDGSGRGPKTLQPHLLHLKDGAIDFIAGTAGGIANVYSAQPLDTVKGTVPALVANVSENAVLFTSYGFCQKIVARTTNSSVKQMTPLANATAGSLAAFFAALVLCPTELVKCKLQAQSEVGGEKKKPTYVCLEMYRSGGIRSFFVGLSATMVREIPGYFCFFGTYEFCRNLFKRKDSENEDIGVLRTAISGGVGGMALWISIFPADLIVKSRMQIAGHGKFFTSFSKIIKNEGVSALYKGITPTLIRTCLASGALFITYENTKNILHAL